jgi:peptidyl-prolyl cis-trans isomerase SurA
MRRPRRPGDAARRWAAGWAAAAWLLAVCPALVTRPPAADAASMTDRIVAVVNTEVITLSELKAELEPDEKRFQEEYKGADFEKRLYQLQYTALTRMIERKLQVQVAASKGVDVSENDVNQAISDMKRQGEKIDEKDPVQRRALKDQLLLLRLVEREVRSAIMVIDPELRKYYAAHQSRFSLPEEYRLSQILFLQRSSETSEEVRARADDVYAKLKRGGDFGDLAFRFSAGAEASRGGTLGTVRQGEMLPEIERAVAQLQPGQFTQPIESPQGLHIIRLDEKKPLQYRPFSEVKSEIQGLVFQQKSEDYYQAWLGNLKNKAYIEIKF